MSNIIGWVSVKDKLPPMDGDECTIEVLLHFGSHVESGRFFFDEINGKPYHVFFDGDSLNEQPTHWHEMIPLS